MNDLIRCPRCGDSYYAERYYTTTAIGWEPIFRNGVLQNSNPNKVTVVCHCCTCGNDFAYTEGDNESVVSI